MAQGTNNKQQPHVVVIGAGFGGLRVVKSLACAPVNITLIDRHNYHLFQPLLYQVATAGLSPEDIAHPIRSVIRNQKNATFRLAEVLDVDLLKKVVHTSTGDIPYDYLVLAVGGVTNFFGMESVAKHSFGLKSVDEAVNIRNHILKMFELADQEPDPDRRRALLTFTVVGGGPTGVECAGAISELIHQVLDKEYRNLNIKEARIIQMEATNHLLAAMPEKLREKTARTLWEKHVDVRFGAVVTDFDGEKITLKSGEIIPSRTLIWAAGVKASDLLSKMKLKLGSQGRAVVNPDLRLPEHPEVFVIGDAAHLEQDGKPLPMVAPVAVQQGTTVAENIRRLIAGEETLTFHYKDPGTMATIGKNAAVARIGKWETTGFIAWVLWWAVHILSLVDYRSQIFVFFKWAWEYFTFDRAVRLITRE